MRFLRLTTPLMHGEDVRTLQAALNAKHGQHLAVDGQYGPDTQHAVGTVAWALGLGETVALAPVQRIIEGHELRSPLDLQRAKHRAAEARAAGQGLAGVIEHALTHVGVSEEPPGSNAGSPEPDGWEANFGMHGVSWCGCFAGSMVLAAGGHVTDRVAYVPYIVADAKAGASGFVTFVAYDGDLSPVKPGWLVTYDWSGGHSFGEHVGVVKELVSGGVIACEGNTSGTNASDGGMVAVMTRDNADIIGYCEPKFS